MPLSLLTISKSLGISPKRICGVSIASHRNNIYSICDIRGSLPALVVAKNNQVIHIGSVEFDYRRVGKFRIRGSRLYVDSNGVVLVTAICSDWARNFNSSTMIVARLGLNYEPVDYQYIKVNDTMPVITSHLEIGGIGLSRSLTISTEIVTVSQRGLVRSGKFIEVPHNLKGWTFCTHATEFNGSKFKGLLTVMRKRILGELRNNWNHQIVILNSSLKVIASTGYMVFANCCYSTEVTSICVESDNVYVCITDTEADTCHVTSMTMSRLEFLLCSC